MTVATQRILSVPTTDGSFEAILRVPEGKRRDFVFAAHFHGGERGGFLAQGTSPRRRF